MTDVLLAVVVVGAVVAFGALISVGNERQRRAIEALHQAYKQWAVQDLRLKRGTVSTQTRIEDPTVWLTKVTSLAFGHQTNVKDYQLHSRPVVSIEFQDTENGTTVVCALERPEVLMLALRRKEPPMIRGELQSNPLLRVGKKTPAVELSILNAGTMFDVELPVAWNGLTGQATQADALWAYILQ